MKKCLLVLILTANLYAINNYYVATTGSNSNSGTDSGHPWATIGWADAHLVVGAGGTCTAGSNWISRPNVGACVHVASGAYSINPTNGIGIETDHSGTSSARIAYVSDTQYGAVLNFQNNFGTFWYSFNAFMDVVGFEMKNTNSGSAYINHIPEAHDNAFIGNKVHDIDTAGNLTNCCTAVEDGYAGVNPTSPLNNHFERNIIYHVNGGTDPNHTVSGNSAGALVAGWGSVIRDNIIVDIGYGVCTQISHTANAVIYTNNTLINCDGGGILFDNPSGYQGGTQDFTTVTNNIIANMQNTHGIGGIDVFGGSATCGAHNVLRNNVVYNNVPWNIGGLVCSNPFTNTLSGSNTGFVNYTGLGTGDYHLKTGSAAIGSGVTACATSGCVPTIDFDGKATNNPPDIGAYSFSGGGTPPSPPSGLNVVVN